MSYRVYHIPVESDTPPQGQFKHILLRQPKKKAQRSVMSEIGELSPVSGLICKLDKHDCCDRRRVYFFNLIKKSDALGEMKPDITKWFFKIIFKRASCSKYKRRSDLAPNKLSLACFSLNARWRDPCSRHSSTFLINSNLWSIVNGGDVGAASKSRRIPGSWLIKERLLWATSSRWILHASRLTADHTHLHMYPHLHHHSLTPTRQY